MISKHEYVSCCVHLNVSRPQTGAAQALDPGGGGYSLIWAILVCAAPKGMVFQPFWS